MLEPGGAGHIYFVDTKVVVDFAIRIGVWTTPPPHCDYLFISQCFLRRVACPQPIFFSPLLSLAPLKKGGMAQILYFQVVRETYHTLFTVRFRRSM